MKRRTYAIPIASAITATLTSAITGCTAPIVGDWELTEVTEGNTTTSYPLTYSYGDYSYELGMQLTVDKELAGTLKQIYSYSYGGQLSTNTYSYAIDVDQEARRVYELTIDDEILDCTVSGDIMDCDFETDENYTAVWERL
jgi:formylmethanofuran dehydrogenase subunit E-like metal-binding protein